MTTIKQSEKISGLRIVHLQSYADDRGRFMETFRKEWFPERSWKIVQCNRSDSKRGVLRGLHYHHHQVDYWYVVSGSLRAGLVDIRPASPTYLKTQIIEMGDDNQKGLFIPSGVAHGFVALSDVSLTYIVDNYFDAGRDEYGVAWNDQAFNLYWGIVSPMISERDQTNPLLVEIPIENLPG